MEVIRDSKLAFQKADTARRARLPRLRDNRLLNTDQSRDDFPGTRDFDCFAALGTCDKPRKLRLGIVNIDCRRCYANLLWTK